MPRYQRDWIGRSALPIILGVRFEQPDLDQQGLRLLAVASHGFGQLEWRPLTAARIALGDAGMNVDAEGIARFASDTRAGKIVPLALVERKAEPTGQRNADLARHAERSLVKLITDGNQVLSESVKFQAEQLRQRLRSEAGDETLERLLIEHVVLCWLELHYVRTAAAQSQQHRTDSRFWEQRFERANARFTSAIKELATLRELIGRPAVVPAAGATSRVER